MTKWIKSAEQAPAAPVEQPAKSEAAPIVKSMRDRVQARYKES